MDSMRNILMTKKYYDSTNIINDELKPLIIIRNEGKVFNTKTPSW